MPAFHAPECVRAMSLGLSVALVVVLVGFLFWVRALTRLQETHASDLELIDRALDGRKLPTDPDDVVGYLAAKYGSRPSRGWIEPSGPCAVCGHEFRDDVHAAYEGHPAHGFIPKARQ